MKYYIPTSSLNLDNILQAESISPYSFYAQRKSGYRSIEILSEFRTIDYLLLFKKPIRFTINDPNRYNFPMLIEIEDDMQLKDLRDIGKGVYVYSETLYLTPWNCRIFFFSEEAYNLTTINTKNNKSIKFYNKYQIIPTVKSLRLEEFPQISYEEIGANTVKSKEFQLDKEKGLLFGYLLGENLSVSSDLAHLNRVTQELYDMLSTVIANPKYFLNFKDKLNQLLNEYQLIDFVEKENERVFNDNLNRDLEHCGILRSAFNKLLKKWGEDISDSISEQLSTKWKCKKLPKLDKSVSSAQCQSLIMEIESRTQNQNKEFKRNKQQPTFDLIDLNDSSINITNAPSLSIAINYVINNKLTNEQLVANRSRICVELINVIKKNYINKYGEEVWHRELRDYFNALYEHIKNIKSPFDLNSIKNAEFIAVAAFLLYGDNIANYLNYLRKNEVVNYAYPLMLWGVLSGYMEMNRDILYEVLTQDNYRNIYDKLLGINKVKKPNIEFITSGCFLSALNCVLKETDKVFVAFVALQRGLHEGGSLDFQKVSRILDLYKNCHAQCRKVKILLEIIENRKNAIILSNLMKELNLSKNNRKRLEEILDIQLSDKNMKATVSRVENTLPLFEDDLDIKQSTLFVFDNRAWNVIENIVPDESRKMLKRDLEWFQKEMQDDKRQYYQKIDPCDNVKTIQKFCELKRQEKGGKPQAYYFTDELRKQIKERLISHYVN